MLRVWVMLCVAGVGLLAGSARAATSMTADGRRYEMVSPLDKNGGDIAADSVSIVSAADGNAVAYLSRGSFGDTVGSGVAGQTQYVARRGAAQWANHAVTPTQRYDSSTVFAGGTVILGFASDLRNVVVWGYDLPGVTGAPPQTANIYVEDTTSRTLRLVTMPSGPVGPYFDFIAPNPGGVSADSRHIAFDASVQLLPEAPPGAPSVYRWDDGMLRLASILPDGTPASAGAVLARARYRETVSPDGSRVLFFSPPGDPSGQLYMRVEDDHTVWVSEPENGGPPPQDVVLQQVTGDSRHVIFATTSRLLGGDPNDGSDLYLYTDSARPESDANLTLVSDTGDVPGDDLFAGTAVVGSSDDARRIYYYKQGQILLWHDGATSAVADDVSSPPSVAGEDLRVAATAVEPGGARVTPDGRFLTFISNSDVRRGGNPVAASGGHTELYVYDAVQDTLRCASCPASGTASADASVIPSVTTIFPRLSIAGLRPSFLADDGRTFFSTTEALVPQDVNGVTDAYEFDPATGEVVLLSTGKGSGPTSFAAASASGDDAFIVTRQQLVRADRDSLVDVYDARVGGGLPEPPDAASCDGDACQGALSPAPEEGSPGSLHVDSEATPRGRIRVVRRDIESARARLRIVLPAAGSVTWRGHGLRHGSRRFSTVGTHTVDVALTARARRALKDGRTVHVRVRLTFTPSGAPSTSVTASLTFKRPSSKKGR